METILWVSKLNQGIMFFLLNGIGEMGPPPSMSLYHRISFINLFCFCVFLGGNPSRAKGAPNVFSIDTFEDLSADRLT